MTALAFPKYRKGRSWREEKALKRRAIDANEARVRRAMRKRDGYGCRVPECRERGEMAHIRPKGMGSDHGIRTTTANVLSCCFEHHQGRVSIHSGDLVVEKLTRAGADGRLAYRWPDGRRIEEVR